MMEYSRGSGSCRRVMSAGAMVAMLGAWVLLGSPTLTRSLAAQDVRDTQEVDARTLAQEALPAAVFEAGEQDLLAIPSTVRRLLRDGRTPGRVIDAVRDATRDGRPVHRVSDVARDGGGGGRSDAGGGRGGRGGSGAGG